MLLFLEGQMSGVGEGVNILDISGNVRDISGSAGVGVKFWKKTRISFMDGP